MTLAQLERKVNTDSNTIKQDCEELEFYKLVKMEKQIHPKNGRNSYLISITNEGLEVL